MGKFEIRHAQFERVKTTIPAIQYRPSIHGSVYLSTDQDLLDTLGHRLNFNINKKNRDTLPSSCVYCVHVD